MKAPGRPLARGIAIYALPLVGSQVLSLFGSTASKALLRHLVDTQALATSALPLPWIGLCIAVASGLSGGAIVLVARAKDGDPAQLRIFCAQALGAALLLGTFFAALGALFAPQILHVQNTPRSLLAIGVPYARIAAITLPFTLLYTIYAGIREALDDSRTPLLMLAGYLVLYVALMPPLMLGLGPFPRMGALAAPIAQLAAIAVVVFVVAVAFRIPVRLPARASLRDMLAIDIPISAQYTGVAIADLLIFRFANQQGVAAVAAYTAMLTAIAYATAPAAIFSTAANVFTAEALGAKRLRDARMVLGITLRATCISSVAIVAALYLFVRPALSVMLGDGNAFALGAHALFVMLWSVPLLNAGTLLCGVMRAGKETVAPMTTTLAGVFALQLPVTWWLSAHGDPASIWKGYAWAYAAIGAMQMLYFSAIWSRKSMGADEAAPMPA